jgi:putative NIF3 family GTP cyclohydrolase 1 type 2
MDTSVFSSSSTRREFVTGSLAAVGLAAFPATASVLPQGKLSVQQVIDLILKEIPGTPFEKSVDTLKSGRADQEVTGIVTTMFATVEVIRKAIDRKANFIIVHEPTFYNHLDETEWLKNDTVYSFKKKLLEEHQIAIWRFHDCWHMHNPDGIRMGVLTALGWKEYYDAANPRIITIPPTSLKKIITYSKDKLNINYVRMIGDPEQVCKRILLMPGASGGRSQIQALEKEKPDLLICGEVAEWETSEYIRDAMAMGLQRSLIVLGHAQSEEPGMQWLVQWLQPKVPGLSVTHIEASNPFTRA